MLQLVIESFEKSFFPKHKEVLLIQDGSYQSTKKTVNGQLLYLNGIIIRWLLINNSFVIKLT